MVNFDGFIVLCSYSHAAPKSGALETVVIFALIHPPNQNNNNLNALLLLPLYWQPTKWLKTELTGIFIMFQRNQTRYWEQWNLSHQNLNDAHHLAKDQKPPSG